MEKNMKHIDNLFKDELGFYAETPPPPAWDSLEKRLNERRRRKFPYGWFWYVGVVTCVVLLGASLLLKMTWGVPANTANAGLLASNAIAVSPKQATENEAKDHDINGKGENNVIAENNKDHSKQSPKHHNNHRLSTIATKNGVAHHTSNRHNDNTNKERNNGRITTTQKVKTNEELYADEDDDQYTVGYSSNARKNSMPSAENDNGPEYVVQQRSHDHIRVAEMAPTQNSSEAVYSSNASISASNEKLALQSRNSKKALQTDQAKSDTAQHAQGKPHRHNTATENRSIAQNSTIKKAIGNQAVKTIASGYKKSKPDVVASPNVLAASLRSVKLTDEKKEVTLATNHNRGQAQKKTTKPAGKKNATGNMAIGHVVTGNEIATVNKNDNNEIPKPAATTVTTEMIANAIPSKKVAEAKKTGKKIAATTDLKKTSEEAVKANAIAAVTASKLATPLAVDASNNENPKGEKLRKKTVIRSQKSYASIPGKKDIPKQSAIYQAATTGDVKTNKPVTAPVKNAHVGSTKSGIKHVTSNDKKAMDKVLSDTKVSKPVNVLAAPAKTIDAGSVKSGIKHIATNDKKTQDKTFGDTKVSKPVNTLAAAAKIIDAGSIKSGIKHIATNDKKTQDKALGDTKVSKPVNTFTAAAKAKTEKAKVKQAAPVASTVTAKSGIAKKEQVEKAKTRKEAQAVLKKAETVNIPVAKNDIKTAKKSAHKKSGGNGGNNANLPAQKAPVNIFSTSFSNRTVADETAMIDNLQVNNFNDHQQLHSNTSGEESLSSTFKQNELKPYKSDSTLVNSGAMTDTGAKHKPFLKRFELGVKAGYEAGFVKYSANKFVVSPFVQYNISDKFALLTLPTVKVAQLGNVNVGSPKSYSSTLSTTHSGVIDSGVIITYAN